MEFNEYQQLAIVTRNPALGKEAQLAMGALGLTGEAGETAEMIKKHLYHDHPLDIEKLSKEIGDVLWYIASLSQSVGLKLEDVAAKNIEKLKARYPQGFSAQKSLFRNE